MPARLTPGQKIMLGGREFLPVANSTVEHDFCFLELGSKAGLGDRLTPSRGETTDVYLQRVVISVAGTGEILRMIGCLIIPADRVEDADRAGEYWTREICEETAAYVGQLKAEGDKEVIRGLLPDLLFPFLENGLSSLRNSTASSASTTSPEPNNGSRGSGVAMASGKS